MIELLTANGNEAKSVIYIEAKVSLSSLGGVRSLELSCGCLII